MTAKWVPGATNGRAQLLLVLVLGVIAALGIGLLAQGVLGL